MRILLLNTTSRGQRSLYIYIIKEKRVTFNPTWGSDRREIWSSSGGQHSTCPSSSSTTSSSSTRGGSSSPNPRDGDWSEHSRYHLLKLIFISRFWPMFTPYRPTASPTSSPASGLVASSPPSWGHSPSPPASSWLSGTRPRWFTSWAYRTCQQSSRSSSSWTSSGRNTWVPDYKLR